MTNPASEAKRVAPPSLAEAPAREARPFLILHKVRGEPAFDVAEKMECPICRDRGEPCEADNCEDGHWWIISTSGHRAYPYWTCPIYSLCDVNDRYNHRLLTTAWGHYLQAAKGTEATVEKLKFIDHLPPMPEGLPDHYACNDTYSLTQHVTISASALLRSIGLGSKPIRRRKL